MNSSIWRRASLILVLTTLASCQAGENVSFYSDDVALRLDLTEEKLTILQLTDLHLTFGVDYNDRKTFQLIEALVDYAEPDLVVFSGDQSMAPFGPILFQRLAHVVEALDVPWTFVFGNHDNDHAPYEKYLANLENYENLLFKVGPELVDGGFGNFKIETYFDNLPFYNLYLLDTHAETTGDLEYGWLSAAQVAWYEEKASVDQLANIYSSVFMHIPLMEYEEYVNTTLNDGKIVEGIYHQGMNTGFFQAMVDHGVSQAVFVGHDHLNTFSFYHQGILLAYGAATGYNGYGNTPKGGRIIEIDASNTLVTNLVFDTEVEI
ncbi:MAG: metallophosphoesterase [Bacilli bacterium]|nr:metallophosphoesterase [Bacilli bacterium]